MRCLVKVRTTNIRLDVRSNMFRSKRLLLAVIGLTAACLVAAYIRRPAQMAVVNETYDAWELDGSFGFPVRVAWNRLEPPGPPGLNFRDIFLFIEPEDFTERNLTAIFTGLDRRYPEPGTLLILVLTSREHLQRQIVSLQTPAPMDNVDHSLEPESEGIMLTSGFYRAYYERRNGGCRYSYSPDPHTKELRTVVLREKQIPYSGDRVQISCSPPRKETARPSSGCSRLAPTSTIGTAKAIPLYARPYAGVTRIVLGRCWRAKRTSTPGAEAAIPLWL